MLCVCQLAQIAVDRQAAIIEKLLEKEMTRWEQRMNPLRIPRDPAAWPSWTSGELVPVEPRKFPLPAVQ